MIIPLMVSCVYDLMLLLLFMALVVFMWRSYILLVTECLIVLSASLNAVLWFHGNAASSAPLL